MKKPLLTALNFRLIAFFKSQLKIAPTLNFCLFLTFISQVFILNQAHAQNVNTYDFAQNIGTFSPLINGSGPTLVPAIKANDAISAALPIGFTFNYAGGNYTNVYASSNGFLTFFGASPLPPTNITPLKTASTGSMAIIAPLWGDLNYLGAPGSAAASYQTTGAPGNRVFTFQWLNWQWGDNGSTTSAYQDISFQVKLYEGSDKIEFYYRRESLNSNIYNNHASMGLAGPSTGSPDFLSVFPFTSSTPYSISVEAQHNVRPVTGQIVTLTKSALKDIQVVELSYPTVTTCGPNIPVSVTIKNMGGVPLDFSVSPLTITGAVTGPNPATFNVPVTGTLAVNASMDVVVLPNYDMTAGGTYTFNATANLTGDGRPNNDAMPAATRTVAPIATVPQFVNFNGFDGTNLSTVFPGWVKEALPTLPGFLHNWDAATGLGSTNNVTAKAILGSSRGDTWIKSPKVVVSTSTELRFKAAITKFQSFDAQPNALAGTDDKIYVMISSDCGTSFSPLLTMDGTNTAGLTNVLTEQTPISLAAYAGQTVIIGFLATNGSTPNPAYDFHLDDISISTPPATDLGVLSMQSPIATGCLTNAENVTVTVKNFGSSTIDFTTKPAQVQAKVTVTGNATPTLLNAALTTGTLAPGAMQVVNLTPAVNMVAGGTYNFKAYTIITGDNNALNDTLTIARTVAPTFALPSSVNFTGYTNSTNVQGFTALFPGWWSTTGVTPNPNPLPGGAGWGPWNGVGQSSNVTGVVNLWDNQLNSWLIGPKIAATPTTEFRFKVAITAYPNTNPYPLGMAGTDDKVQVMVSTNCGVSYSPIYTIDASNSGTITHNLSEIVVPLGAYAGQRIIVAIFATDGAIDDANNYFFHIDDLVLRNVFTTDVSSIKAVTKSSGCGLTATEQVCVVVKNEGVTAQSNIPVSFRVNNGAIVSEVIPGPIQPLDTLRYCFTGKANFAANGTYTLKIFTGLTTDANIANDTIRRTVISYTAVPLTSSNGGSRCGAGPVTLTATAPNNLPINWYTAATGGTLVATGTTYTPTVTATTTYYAGTVTGLETTGKLAHNDNLKATSGGLIFNASQTFDLKSVVVYTDIAAGGSITIQLRDAANTILQTKNFTLPPVSGKTAVTVPVDFNSIAPGTGYRLTMASGLQLYRDQSTSANPIFPIVSPSQTVTITDGTFNGYYGYFYNWTIAVCTSSQRTPVIATVNSAPVINLGSNATICGTTPAVLDAGNAGSTFQWSLNGNPIAGATSQTYSATTPGTYSVSVTNATNCSSVSSVQVSNTSIATPTVTASGPLTICQGSTLTLTGATATAGVTYQWHLNNAPIAGATSATLNATAAGNYMVVASISGCSSNSAVTAITVTPKPTTPVVTLAGNTLSSNAATGNQWYSVSGSTLTLIPGATLQTYTPAVPGNYTVKVTVNGCESDGPTAVNVLLGISKLAPGIDLKVYPNPSTGNFLVELPKGKTYQLEVTDLNGKVIMQKQAKGDTQLNLETAAKGIYLLKVSSENGTAVRKLIVE